jgi:hypothetical protein
MKRSYFIILFFIVQFSVCKVIAQCPVNLDFENGTKSGWICKSGTVFPGNIVISPGNCKDPGGPNAALLNPANQTVPALDQQVIVSAGTDPNSGLSVVAPGGGKYSLRLGDATGGNGTPLNTPALAVGISYELFVTPQNAALTYMYAVVLCEDIEPVRHTPAEASRFEVIIKDANGIIIKCSSYTNEATSHTYLKPGEVYIENGRNMGRWWYSEWTNVAVDLRNYVGKFITMEFRVSDCNPFGSRGGHGAYAYIDAKCGNTTGITNMPAICAGINTVSVCVPAGGSNYKWEQLKKLTGIIGDTIDHNCVEIKTPAAGEVYRVSYRSREGCDVVLTDTLKNLQVSTLKDIILCPKNTPNYQLKTTINTANKVTYTWHSIPAGFTSTLQYPLIATPAQNTLYVVTAKDVLSGCTAVDTVRIVSSCNLKVITNPATICAGTCTTLQAAISGGTPPYTYKWRPGDMSQATVNVCPALTTVYTVTVRDSTGTADSSTVVITVLPLPDVKLLPFNTGILTTSSPAFDLTGGTPVGGIYWGKGVVGTKFDPAVAGEGTHTITYTYTDNKGCINTAAQTIIVSSPSDVTDLLTESRLSVYPNPHTQSFTIAIAFLKPEHVKIQLINMLGEVVNEIDDASVTGNYKKQVNTVSLPAGIYFLSATTKEHSITKKLIKN